MRIEHIAVYVMNLELMRDFYVKYFEAESNVGYHNTQTDFRSFFLTFKDGVRMEIMNKPGLADKQASLVTGYVHVAFSVGSDEAVDVLTSCLHEDGYTVLSGPRMTGDGYYESCILDPEGNVVEITR